VDGKQLLEVVLGINLWSNCNKISNVVLGFVEDYYAFYCRNQMYFFFHISVNYSIV
jgi:hypothetical protein